MAEEKFNVELKSMRIQKAEIEEGMSTDKSLNTICYWVWVVCAPLAIISFLMCGTTKESYIAGVEARKRLEEGIRRRETKLELLRDGFVCVAKNDS